VIALTLAALCGGMTALSGIADADVASSAYTIGTPTPPVSDVVASPSTVTTDTSTNFEVRFTLGTALSGSAGDTITIVPSVSLGSTPMPITLTGSSCAQAGTNGGTFSATGLTINVESSCTIAAGTVAEVDFAASAPAVTGAFSFIVTTSQNDTRASSNAVTVTTAGPVLTAASQAFGANTTYTISNASVTGLSSAETSLALTAAPTSGSGTIAFVNGAAGYSVMVTPAGGSATSDAVEAAAASGATVTLTLASGLVTGDTLDITAPGQNPASSATSEANKLTVQPGNGTPVATNAIAFGGSVTDVTATPSVPVATASSTYTVGFDAADAVAAGGDILLTETAGPTIFSTITSIEVTDSTQNWHFIATGASLSEGAATIPLQDAISAGDSLSVTLANVTNPPAAGPISDFEVATTGDPVPAAATTYSIEANGSPGVVVAVDPSSVVVPATYTISNLFADGALTGGSGTIKLEGPAGTVFPNNPSFYSIQDATTPSGSGTVTAALTGGGTNAVTFTVPNTINAGDALTLTVSDVRNPSTASSTDSITLAGSLTGPPPTALTTTTSTTTTVASAATTTTTTTPAATTPAATTPAATTSTTPAHTATTTTPTTTTTAHTAATAARGAPVVHELTARARVRRRTIDLKLTCTAAACKGTVTLTHQKTAVARVKYAIRAGKTTTIDIRLAPTVPKLLAVAKHHTITVTATITVADGKTVRTKVTIVG
jgi:hypothetical protein